MSHIEMEYAEFPWGTEERLLIAQEGDLVVTAKDVGQGISSDKRRWVQVMAHLSRMPRELWWDEIRDAWYERRRPVFWRVRMTLTEDSER